MSNARLGGYKFESMFKKSFKQCYPDGFIYKLIDTHSIEGITKAAKKQNKAWGSMVVPKVVSDFICIHNGITMFVECKSTQNKTSFPLRNVKDHQFEFASEVELAGGLYVFMIRRQESKNDEYFIITLNDIIRLKKANNNNKSIKWEQLREDPYIKRPPRMKGAKFDLKCLFDGI